MKELYLQNGYQVIEGMKLLANLPRFQRKDFRMKSSEVRGKGREAEVKYGDHVVQTRGIRDPVGK